MEKDKKESEERQMSIEKTMTLPLTGFGDPASFKFVEVDCILFNILEVFPRSFKLFRMPQNAFSFRASRSHVKRGFLF